jgi:hypothetical protein
MVHDVDPVFVLPLAAGEKSSDIHLDKGDTIWLAAPRSRGEERLVVGVTIEVAPFVSEHLRIIAPKQVRTPIPDEPYPVFDSIQLRPGTTVLGGRGSGFYDDYGFIVGAQHIGGDPDKFEDWAFYIVAAISFRGLDGQWLLLNDINGAVSGPKAVADLSPPTDKAIDDLLAVGEKELMSFLLSHPDMLAALSPRQFERLALSIYRNLGFDAESVGAWNQADGGVDIVAVSKTAAATDFRLAIQCKASSRKVSARPIRELAGVLNTFHADQGVVATTSTFTQKARREAEGTLWKVKLQDRNAILRRLMAIVRPDLKEFVDRLD